MNPNREIAYRVDPALWVREVLGITADVMANEVPACTTGVIHSCFDRTTGWQNDGSCLGNGAHCSV